MTSAPSPEGGPGDAGLLATWHEAVAVLLSNWRGMSTVPSRHLYPHQWSWDSAFISIGTARWHQARAEAELMTAFSGQWGDGTLPHIIFDRSISDEAYFPGPAFWQSPPAPRGSPLATSGITQPPVHAGAALEMYRRAANQDRARGFLERLLPSLDRQLACLRDTRDVGGLGLLSIVHPWESGLDNSPAWDEAMQGLTADESYVVPPRPDIAHIDPEERPGSRDYSIYAMLAETYRDSGYDASYLKNQHPFVVEDPLFNACYIWSLDAISRIREVLGRTETAWYTKQAEATRRAMVDHLWNPAAEVFQARNARTGTLSPAITVGGVVPLIDRALPKEQREALRRTLRSPHFRLDSTKFGVPSNDLEARSFDRRLYWRGPSWVNTSWLLWNGLQAHGYPDDAERVRCGVLAALATSGPYEYFDPFDGSGRGSADFSWTAALALDMLAGTVA